MFSHDVHFMTGDPQKPQLSIPENIFKNQETAFNCSGNVGRKEDGSPVVALGFEILPEVTLIFEPRCEKTGLRGFRPGPTQTGLFSHTRWLEA